MSRTPALAVLALLAVLAVGCSKDNPLTTEPSVSFNAKAPADARPGDLKEGIPAASEPEASSKTVVLPAGSVDGLAAAIAAAGPNGKVIVEAGNHTESGTVTITQRVEIAGEPGAVLTSATDPATVSPGVIEPALHVLGASKVSISGLEMKPAGAIGGTAILFESSPDGEVKNNRMSDYQIGVLLHHADRAMIRDNVIAATTAWRGGTILGAFPIIAMNGKGVRIIGNDASNGVFNIFACDEDGTLSGNRVHQGRIGIILCKVPAGNYQLPSGEIVGAERPATAWMCFQNNAENNIAIGYLVIDSANNNTLVDNAASNNGRYDMELTADTFRFGFLTPASFDNTVRAGKYGKIRIKDCGNNNTVIGGVLVDNGMDPCN
jgi:nitrous oxidase accessory protein NosD